MPGAVFSGSLGGHGDTEQRDRVDACRGARRRRFRRAVADVAKSAPRIHRVIKEEVVRALLVAVGTRGDVQPALALALELRKLGHAVRMCVSPNFVDWAKSLGLDALPMGVEMRMPAQDGGQWRVRSDRIVPERL